MTHYLRTDAVNRRCQIAFASWVVPPAQAVVFSSSSSRSPHFRRHYCGQNQPLAIHQQALTALLASVLIATFRDGLGTTTKKRRRRFRSARW